VYKALANYPLALEHYEKCLAIRLKALGPDHPEDGGSYSRMAGGYKAQGNYPLALEQHEKSLAIRLKALGPDDPSTIAVFDCVRICRERLSL
jgi:tetratricopeptide (TPR) repeat protein